MTYYSNKKQAGFTLVEVALIVTVLGLIIAPFFNFLSQRYLKKQLVKTEEKTERITAALSGYLLENGRYPLPADPSLGPDDSNFGLEDTSSTLSGGIYYGALPTQTLRLPVEDSVNIHGWKYLYAVVQAQTNTTTFNPLPTAGLSVSFDNDNDGDIDAADNITGAVQTTSKLHFIVVDPGEDGKGSASLNGSYNFLTNGFFNCTGSVRDADNCNKDGDFVQMARSTLVGPTNSKYYDDTLIFLLARKESTFWELGDTTSNAAAIDISMRAAGNLGIGLTDTQSADAKLHIRGGNVKAIAAYNDPLARGSLSAQSTFNIERNLTVPTINASDVSALNGYFYMDVATASPTEPTPEEPEPTPEEPEPEPAEPSCTSYSSATVIDGKAVALACTQCEYADGSVTNECAEAEAGGQ